MDTFSHSTHKYKHWDAAIWNTIEKIQDALYLDESAMACFLLQKTKNYKLAKRKKQPINAVNLMHLAVTLGLRFEDVVLGKIDFSQLSPSQNRSRLKTSLVEMKSLRS